MSLDVTFLGHAGFLLSDGKHAIALDPFLSGNPVARHKPAEIKVQYIALTHGHADHVGDTVAIAKANGAKVIGAYEITEHLAQAGCSIEPANPGGKVPTDFGWVALTQAFHSSSYEGRYMGMPCGLVIRMGGVTFYHTGDTCLFGDMKLIGEIYKPDIAAICAGDRFTMGPELACRSAEFIAPKVAIPIHWGTWPILAQDMAPFKPAGVEVKIMKPGETFKYGPGRPG